MTNVKSSNQKLRERSLRILMSETNLNADEAQNLMKEAGGDLRVAIVMHKANVSSETAKKALILNGNIIEKSIARIK